MSEPINPYAAPSSVDEDSFHAVHFGGTATLDDLMMSLNDTPPKKGYARLQMPLSMLVVAAAILIFAVNFSDGREPPPSYIWIVFGFVALPTWLKVARILTPGRRKQVMRIQRMAGRQNPTWGWFEEKHVVVRDERSVLKAEWSFFGMPMVFPEHLMLPLRSDANRRIVLPWRFFVSPDEAKSLIQFLTDQHSALSLNQPKPDRLVELTNQCDGYVHSDIEQAEAWSGDQWPFDSEAAGQFDCQIDTAAAVTTRRFALYSAIGFLFVIVWYFLPFWTAAFGWLIYEYHFFGDWTFLTERMFSSMFVIVPIAATLMFFLYSMIKAVLASREIQRQPMGIRIRDSGIHLSHETFQSWFRWALIKDLIVEDDRAGWVIEETDDEIAYPKVCFENEAAFEQFKTELQRLSP